MRQGATIPLVVLSAFFMALSGALSTGCGPVGYISQVTIKADASVAAAKAAGAETLAPYWYTRAIEYLHKAREEASYADFQAANRFGRKAHEAAKNAEKLAIERAANPDDKDWMPPPGAPGAKTPAKDGNTEHTETGDSTEAGDKDTGDKATGNSTEAGDKDTGDTDTGEDVP